MKLTLPPITPGDWTYDKQDRRVNGGFRGTALAILQEGSISPARVHSNGQAIAALPALLRSVAALCNTGLCPAVWEQIKAAMVQAGCTIEP